MSDEYLEALETAREALRDLLDISDPGGCFAVRTAYSSIRDAIKAKERPAPPADPVAASAAWRQEQARKWKEQTAPWDEMGKHERERRVIEIIGKDRRTITQVLGALQRAIGQKALHQSDARGLVMRLYSRGELDRVVDESFRGKLRYLYFRKVDLSGPIAELEREFRGEDA